MKKSRFTDSQIVAVLKEGDAGVPVAQLVRKHGISTTTYYTWRSKYAGVGVSDLKRMRELLLTPASHTEIQTGPVDSMHATSDA
jgi:putative transposase